MTTYTVSYFDFPGSRGEEVRLAFVIAGQAFHDNRLNHDGFMAIKAGLPNGAVPVLEIDGKGMFGQTNAILRLVGRLFGLHPDDIYEAARHDALMEAVEELRIRIGQTIRMPEDQKVATRAALAEETIPAWAKGVDGLIGADAFVGGAAPSVADIKLYMMHRWISSGAIDGIPGDLFDQWLNLTRVAASVAAHPAVLAWQAKAA